MSPSSEETSLIAYERAEVDGDVLVEKKEDRKRWLPSWFASEFVGVLNLSWSLFIISLCNFLMEPIALYFCGRLGPNELAAMALSTSLMNITGLAVGLGLATACDTVFSQSIGSENKTEAGVYLIKSTIIILLFTFPCAAIHLNMEHLLLLIGQPECVARLAGEFMQYFALSLPAVFMEEILMQYLRCQDYLAAPLIIGGSSVVVCFAAHYVMVTVLEYGIIGSAIALVITFYLTAAALLVYILATGMYKDSWRGWTKDIYQNWGAFLKLALAGFVMLAVEWWIWEFSVVTAGWLGTTELGAASISLQIISIDFQIPLGISLAINIRTGQLLGNKDPVMAKRIVYIGAFMTTVQAVVINGLVILLRYEIPRLFTDEEDVIEICATILPIGCLIALVDGQCAMLLGVLRGCGKQLSGSLVMVFGLTAVGLPVALVLQLYAALGLVGFYIGLTFGVAVEFVLLVVIVYRIDWSKMVLDAQVVAGVHKAGGTYQTFSIEERSCDEERTVKPRRSFSRLNLTLDESTTDLSTRTLLVRRPLFVLLMVSTLLLGLYWRLTTEEEMAAFEPCATDQFYSTVESLVGN